MVVVRVQDVAWGAGNFRASRRQDNFLARLQPYEAEAFRYNVSARNFWHIHFRDEHFFVLA